MREDSKKDIIRRNPSANHETKRWRKRILRYERLGLLHILFHPEIPNKFPHLNVLSICIFIHPWALSSLIGNVKKNSLLKIVSFSKLKIPSNFYFRGAEPERGGTKPKEQIEKSFFPYK